MEGEGRDGHRDQIVTCDVSVSLHSNTHSLFIKYSNSTQGAPDFTRGALRLSTNSAQFPQCIHLATDF